MPPINQPSVQPKPAVINEGKLFGINMLILLGYVAVGLLLAVATKNSALLFFTFIGSFVQALILIIIGITFLFLGQKERAKAFLFIGIAFIFTGPFASCAANTFLSGALGTL